MPRMTKNPLALAALLLVLLASLSAETARAEQPLWVLPEAATLRAEKSGLSPAVAELPHGAQVRLVRSEGSWLLVREAGGRTAWVYQGHLATQPPPPLLADVFAPPAQSFILAEAADSARSSRSTSGQQEPPLESLRPILDMPLSRAHLDEFLREGGIGEYAPLANGSHPAPLALAVPKAVAPAGGESERQFGANVAAQALRTLGKPAFGLQLQRTLNLTGLAVARFAPGEGRTFRYAALDNPAPFALGLPGGIVLVSSGLLKALDNEAQLALILARETARVSLGQAWALARSTAFFRAGGEVTRQSVETEPFRAAVRETLGRLLGLEPSAAQERDLDLAALQMAFRAGYDPQQLLPALERVAQAGRALQRPGGPAAVQAPPELSLRRAIAVHQSLSRLPLHQGMALASDRYRTMR